MTSFSSRFQLLIQPAEYIRRHGPHGLETMPVPQIPPERFKAALDRIGPEGIAGCRHDHEPFTLAPGEDGGPMLEFHAHSHPDPESGRLRVTLTAAAADEDHPRKPMIPVAIGHFVWTGAGPEAETMLATIKRDMNPPAAAR